MISIIDTAWSIQMIAEIESQIWECRFCNNEYYLTGIQKLQHTKGTFLVKSHLT